MVLYVTLIIEIFFGSISNGSISNAKSKGSTYVNVQFLEKNMGTYSWGILDVYL